MLRHSFGSFVSGWGEIRYSRPPRSGTGTCGCGTLWYCHVSRRETMTLVSGLNMTVVPQCGLAFIRPTDGNKTGSSHTPASLPQQVLYFFSTLFSPATPLRASWGHPRPGGSGRLQDISDRSSTTYLPYRCVIGDDAKPSRRPKMRSLLAQFFGGGFFHRNAPTFVSCFHR